MDNMEDLLINAFSKVDDIDVVNVNIIDGVRLTFDDGSWVLVRPSGTEDFVRITLEAKNDDKAELIRDVSSEVIKDNLNNS